jgi:hypothetical protein
MSSTKGEGESGARWTSSERRAGLFDRAVTYKPPAGGLFPVSNQMRFQWLTPADARVHSVIPLSDKRPCPGLRPSISTGGLALLAGNIRVGSI